MLGLQVHRDRESRGWLPARACPWPGVRAGLVVTMALLVMAGLLAMHALSAGHTGHAGDHHPGDHHPGDHHTGITATIPEPGVAAVPLRAAAAAEEHGDHLRAAHEPCPDWLPGHCPDQPTAASMCQAVLNGSGAAALLLLLLTLTLAARDATWPAALRAGSPHADRVRWRAWRSGLRTDGPSLHVLCVSRT